MTSEAGCSGANHSCNWGPNSVKVGSPHAAARWPGPESLPMKTPERLSKATNSVTERGQTGTSPAACTPPPGGQGSRSLHDSTIAQAADDLTKILQRPHAHRQAHRNGPAPRADAVLNYQKRWCAAADSNPMLLPPPARIRSDAPRVRAGRLRKIAAAVEARKPEAFPRARPFQSQVIARIPAGRNREVKRKRP